MVSTTFTRRQGFTLIEMLAVIAIIAVLVSLLSAAVMKALEQGTKVRVVAELRQMDAACVAFKTRFGDYPPSWIRLRRDGNYDLRTNVNGIPLNVRDFMSYRIITQFWPRLQFPVNWNGDNNAPIGSVWELEGDQCLVYFLGGIPYQTPGTLATIGFSTDPTNPARGGTERIPAFFEFHNSRLRNLAGNGFWSYLDPYEETPYAYFSSWNKTPGYADATRQGTTFRTDCQRLGVWPYAEIAPSTAMSTRIWHRKITFQILSAGKDGRFGPGTNLTSTNPGYWTYKDAGNFASQFPDAADDLSNFHDLLMGVPTN